MASPSQLTYRIRSVTPDPIHYSPSGYGLAGALQLDVVITGAKEPNAELLSRTAQRLLGGRFQIIEAQGLLFWFRPYREITEAGLLDIGETAVAFHYELLTDAEVA